jgi:hypothetical protein
MSLDVGHDLTRTLETSPYRLELMALDCADVVRCAGGWIFDYTACGWLVIVVLAECRDPTPLRILGAQVMLPEDVQVAYEGHPPTVLATNTDIYRDDAWVRDRVESAMTHRRSQIVMWGDEHCHPRATPNLCMVHHRLSSAARAFKAHALTALGAPTVVASFESFQSHSATLVSPLTNGGGGLTPIG